MIVAYLVMVQMFISFCAAKMNPTWNGKIGNEYVYYYEKLNGQSEEVEDPIMDGFNINEALFGELTGSLIGNEVCINGYFDEFFKGLIEISISKKKLGIEQMRDAKKGFILSVDLDKLTEGNTKNDLLSKIFTTAKNSFDLSDDLEKIDRNEVTSGKLREVDQCRKKTIDVVYKICEYLYEKFNWMNELNNNRNEENTIKTDEYIAVALNDICAKTKEVYVSVLNCYRRINCLGVDLFQMSENYDGNDVMVLEEEEDEYETSDYVDEDGYEISSWEWLAPGEELDEDTVRECFGCYDSELTKKFRGTYYIFMKHVNKFIYLDISDNSLTSKFSPALPFSNFNEYRLGTENTSLLYCLLYINVIGGKCIPKEVIITVICSILSDGSSGVLAPDGWVFIEIPFILFNSSDIIEAKEGVPGINIDVLQRKYTSGFFVLLVYREGEGYYYIALLNGEIYTPYNDNEDGLNQYVINITFIKRSREERRITWTKEEDTLILNIVADGGVNSSTFNTISETLKTRTLRQVRERYTNYLNPEMRNPLSRADIETIQKLGDLNRFKEAGKLIGRSEGFCKNMYRKIERTGYEGCMKIFSRIRDRKVHLDPDIGAYGELGIPENIDKANDDIPAELNLLENIDTTKTIQPIQLDESMRKNPVLTVKKILKNLNDEAINCLIPNINDEETRIYLSFASDEEKREYFQTVNSVGAKLFIKNAIEESSKVNWSIEHKRTFLEYGYVERSIIAIYFIAYPTYPEEFIRKTSRERMVEYLNDLVIHIQKQMPKVFALSQTFPTSPLY